MTTSPISMVEDVNVITIAKLGSHGGKDIAKVMAITNGSVKRGSG
jgi:hypothetical protein